MNHAFLVFWHTAEPHTLVLAVESRNGGFVHGSTILPMSWTLLQWDSIKIFIIYTIYISARISMCVLPKHPALKTWQVVKCVGNFVEGSESVRDNHFKMLINTRATCHWSISMKSKAPISCFLFINYSTFILLSVTVKQLYLVRKH